MAMKVANIPNMIRAGTVLNAIITSVAQQVYNSFGFSAQVFFTGTPSGSFHLEASDDPAAQAISTGNYASAVTAPTNWSTIANSTFVVSAAGNVMWDYDQPGFNWFRIVYVDGSSGASTAVIASATGNIKGI